MKNLKSLTVVFLTIFLGTYLISCNPDDEVPGPELDSYDKAVISYFKEIALGFEFGGATEVTRKWKAPLKIFVGGNKDPELLSELDRIVTELNQLASDGFSMEVVSDTLASNYYIFFGSAAEYVQLLGVSPSQAESNWGLFYIWWDSFDQLERGHMYVDITRADPVDQRHLLREELTQSLGFGKDSFRYEDSIFQQNWTHVNEYAAIDRDIIRLLYHPNVASGLNAAQVDEILTDILLQEKVGAM